MSAQRIVTVLPGEGIGLEVVPATTRLVDALNLGIQWDYHDIGGAVGGLPEAAIESIRTNSIALKGPTATAGHRSYNVQLREIFDLYANIRPLIMLPRARTLYAHMPLKMVVVRENLEDLYIGEESEIEGGAEAVSRITEIGTERVARCAFYYARENGYKKVTIVAKSNVLPKTHGLFVRVAQKVASEFPDIECEHLIADNALQQLIMHPERYGVLLCPNFLGDLFSDACAAIFGGLGFAPGANIGDTCAIFEPVHGTAPNIAGKNIANPTGAMLSGAMMLDHLGEHESAERIRNAIRRVLKEGKFLTGDVTDHDPVSTVAYTDGVIAAL
jgi:isocitrate dehydrogenase (NAD+)